MAANVPIFKLNNGVLMPSVGMGKYSSSRLSHTYTRRLTNLTGCWMGGPGGGQRVYDMCTAALKAGYRHFDTADGYKNEEEVGRAIRDSGVPRKELFVTTKLCEPSPPPPTPPLPPAAAPASVTRQKRADMSPRNNGDHHRVSEAFQRSLGALDIDYIDLYLVHWPQARVDGRVLAPAESPTIHDTWAEMAKLLETGKVRAVGVSNFGVPLLEALGSDVAVPAVNQVELHPFLPRAALQEYCAAHGIVLTAYSPIGQPAPGTVSPLLTDETVVRVARKHGVAEGQVALSWAVQHGVVVVPKSENPERMRKNITVRPPAFWSSFREWVLTCATARAA